MEHFDQHRTKMNGNASNKMDWQIFMPVGKQIAHHKPREFIDQQLMNGLLCLILGQKWSKRSQEPVGHRLLVDTMNDFICRKPHLTMKCIAYGSRQLRLQHITNQATTKHCTAALISEYVAQRRHILHNFPVLIEATVASRAQDASYAIGISAQCLRGSQQIRCHLHFTAGRHHTSNQTRHAQQLISATSCPIEPYFFHTLYR